MAEDKKVYATTDPIPVAGHLFDNLTHRCVRPKDVTERNPGGVCGESRWIVHTITEADIGRVHPTIAFSCVPTPNRQEYESVLRDKVRWQDERDRAYAAVALCVGGA